MLIKIILFRIHLNNLVYSYLDWFNGSHFRSNTNLVVSLGELGIRVCEMVETTKFKSGLCKEKLKF